MYMCICMGESVYMRVCICICDLFIKHKFLDFCSIRRV